MNWWILAAFAAASALLIYLTHLAIRAAESRELKRMNKELNADLDKVVESAHLQEKREADHEKRVADIIHDNHLDVDRINSMLNTYPPETEAARASKPSGLPH